MQLDTWLLCRANRPAHIGQVAADHAAQHRQVVETEPEIGLNGWVLLAHPLYISLLISSLSDSPVKNGEPERCIFKEIPVPSRQAEIWYDLGELLTMSSSRRKLFGMDPSPAPSQPTPSEKQGSVLTASQWLARRVLVPQDTPVSSLGEFMLPTLLGAMEACWVDVVLIGLASALLLGSSMPLLPLWAPFVFIVGSQWLLHYADRRDGSDRPGTSVYGTGDPGGRPENEEGHVKTSIPGASLLFVIMGAFCLFIIWLQ